MAIFASTTAVRAEQPTAASVLLESNKIRPGQAWPDVLPPYPFRNDGLLVPSKGDIPISGDGKKELLGLDNDFRMLMRKWQIPGGQIAISKNGQLLYSKSFGWADLKQKKPVAINSLFRIASISKAFTAVCALRLVEQGKLALNTRALGVLRYPETAPSSKNFDERTERVEVRHLLNCTGGWDRSRFDPMFAPAVGEAAQEYSPSLRPDPVSAIRSALRYPITFEPGTHYSYSNLGYAILGQLIAKVSGKPYDAVVREQVLEPAGITDMTLGKTLSAVPNEVLYYPFPGQELNRSLFPNIRGLVPLPYSGDFAMEAVPADCGWLSSAADLVRFLSAVFGDGRAPLVTAATRKIMLERPDVPEFRPDALYFAMGFEVVPQSDPLKQIVFRQGSLPGTMAVCARRGDGITWAFVINTRPQDLFGCQTDVTNAIWRAINQCEKVKTIPPAVRPS